MRTRLLFLALASTFLASLFAGCSGEPDIYREPDAVITVKVGQEFIIATSTNPPTGYMWTATIDESMLELVSSTIETAKAETETSALGALEQHFRCRALQKGTTEVQLTLRGPDIQFVWKQKDFPVEIK